MASIRNLRIRLVEFIKRKEVDLNLISDNTLEFSNELVSLLETGEIGDDFKQVSIGVLTLINKALKKRDNIESSAVMNLSHSLLNVLGLIAYIPQDNVKNWFVLYNTIIKTLSETKDEHLLLSVIVSHLEKFLDINLGPVPLMKEYMKLLNIKQHPYNKCFKKIQDGLFSLILKLIKTDLSIKGAKDKIIEYLEDLSKVNKHIISLGGNPKNILCSIIKISAEGKGNIFNKEFIQSITESIMPIVDSITKDKHIEICVSGSLGLEVFAVLIDKIDLESKNNILHSLIRNKNINMNTLGRIFGQKCPSIMLFSSENSDNCLKKTVSENFNSLFSLGPCIYPTHKVSFKDRTLIMQKQDLLSIIILSLVNSDIKIVLARCLSKVVQVTNLLKTRTITEDGLYLISILLEIILKEYPFKYIDQISALLSSICFILKKTKDYDIDLVLKRKLCQKFSALISLFIKDLPEKLIESSISLLYSFWKDNVFYIDYELLKLLLLAGLSEEYPDVENYIKEMKLLNRLTDENKQNHTESIKSLFDEIITDMEQYTHTFSKPVCQISKVVTSPAQDNITYDKKARSHIIGIRSYIDSLDYNSKNTWLIDELSELLISVNKKIKR
eukprot:GHVP01059985.1.p1 GENE.GHVP01059985.1~~GHVP01059985.1.p1  ORF type:complete len:614 (-),score=93.33 GHVP01059985.1:387-2228(-)